MANGKGDKQRVCWCKEFEGNFKKIFCKNKKKEKEMNLTSMVMALLKDNKDEIVDGINKKVNIPLISEAKEEEILDSLFEGFMEIVEGVLNKD
tara:strand:- start:3521 stop:3799 length:279 start_codon:yes stop_codon:yes gene_type:complete